MWKAFARDVICLLSAVVVAMAIVAAIWVAVTLWLLPLTETNAYWVYGTLFAPVVVAVASVGVVLYAALRGRARHGQLLAPPYWRETLALPALVGLAFGLVALLAALLTHSKELVGVAFLVCLAVTVPLVLAAWFIVLVQRFSARPVRVLIVAAVAALALWLGGRVALDVQGQRIFAEYKSTATAEIAAERQRIAAEREPVLFGTPIDDNAADRYRRLTQTLLDALKDQKSDGVIAAAVKDGPAKPQSVEVNQLVAAHQPELAALREAVRCTRCDWHFAWEKGFEAPLPTFTGARRAANLLVIEGYQHAETGDVAGAVQRDLEVIRMGCDYQGSGGMIGVLISLALERIGTDALLRLASADDLSSEPAWDTIQSKLDLIEPRLASLSVGYRSERLVHVGWQPTARYSQAIPGWSDMPVWASHLVPWRFVLADFVRTMNETLGALEKADEVPHPREASRLSQAAVSRALRSRNPLARIAVPSAARARVAQDQATTRFRMLRVVVQLETSRKNSGRYPEDASALDLPVDPFAYPEKLRYASLDGGKGYRLWSVGTDGKDDGGKNQLDEVFEHKGGE